MAAIKDGPMNKISTFISRAFSLRGFSRWGVLLSMSSVLVQDFLNFHLHDIFETYFGGSAAEGTFLAESDFDCMLVLPDTFVQVTNTVPAGVRGHILFLDTSGCRAGFGRLRLVQRDDTENHAFPNYTFNIAEMLQIINGENYLSSREFVKFFVSKLKLQNSGIVSIFQHGPCAMIQNQNIPYSKVDNPDENLEIDVAHALQLDQWPVEAKEWITRKRHYNWPPKEVVHKISQQKCHAVPVGDAKSEYCSLEWRISFLLGERELVWNFNSTQVQCYVILKRLLKKYIEPLAPDQLSSYHLKTVIFWLSEEKGMSVWNDENLLQCVLESLNMLKSCIVKGELQHYFHRQRNLLTYKFEDVSKKTCVLLKIDVIREDIVPHVLQCVVEWEGLYEMWNICNKIPEVFIEAMIRRPSDLSTGYKQAQKVENDRLKYVTLCDIFQKILSASVYPFQILRQYFALVTKPPKEIESSFLEMINMFLDLKLGLAYFSHIIDPMDETFQEFIQDGPMTVQDAETQFCHAEHIDSMAGGLYLASHFFCQNKFSKSNDIILTILRQDKNLIYVGMCSNYKGIQLSPEGNARQVPNNNLCERERKTYPAFDVVFSFQHLHVVPYPVQFECAVAQYDYYNCLLIHPCVYAYFLLCIGHYHVGAPFQEFLSQLDEAVHETIGGFQRYRALNLLGFCYKLNGNLKEAFRCFRESLEETRDFQVGMNAAVYHIGILILSLLEAKEKEDNM
ncbi:hypothetical protein ACJMK2_017971 [Sinanodonta woodiana]|uniref:Mab-21-like HhH/H2TH-like domain-containing protein n=1 Tax=Sinanodonta woodiana TaxID=1069815 RepID=A0ABD3UC04_SINWO